MTTRKTVENNTVEEGADAPSPNIEIWLSTDGKHTVHVTGTQEQVVDSLSVATQLYDDIVEKYGLKAGGGYRNNGGPPRGQAPAGSAVAGVEPECADCGTPIRGFTDPKTHKEVTAEIVAAARVKRHGRVTCGAQGCKQQGY